MTNVSKSPDLNESSVTSTIPLKLLDKESTRTKTPHKKASSLDNMLVTVMEYSQRADSVMSDRKDYFMKRHNLRFDEIVIMINRNQCDALTQEEIHYAKSGINQANKLTEACRVLLKNAHLHVKTY